MESEFYPNQLVYIRSDSTRRKWEVVSWNDADNAGRIQAGAEIRKVTGAEIESAESPESYPVNYWDESNELENED